MGGKFNLGELLLPNPNDNAERTMVVVRVSTSCWHDDNGVYLKKTLRFQKRKCMGYNILYEDSCMTGADSVIDRIVNLYDCKDGLYSVRTCNEKHDWETPHIVDDYDYELIPLEEKTP